MSEIQHTTLKGELLYLIGRATAPLSCADLYEKCELADEVAQVAKALSNLQSDGKIVRVPGEGRARYKLAAGVAAPAPAGKTGRSKAVRADDAARSAPDTGIRPEPETEPGPPALDIPPLADPGISLQGAAGKTQRATASLAQPSPSDDDEIGKGLDLVERRLADERLADAIIARLKRELAPTICELEAAAGLDRMNVHIHIEQVDFHLGGL